MSVSINASALDKLQGFFEALPDIAQRAMSVAINQVVDRDGLVLLKKDMRSQVDFPKEYVDGHLRVVRRASRGSLEAVIRGRDRPTSLARFARGQTPASTRRTGVQVTVRGGRTKTLKKAFLVNLRNGNVGLAVRLKAGETMKYSSSAVKLAENLYLLYGPSVDQVFRGVAKDNAKAIGQLVTKQFLRQFTRMSNRG